MDLIEMKKLYGEVLAFMGGLDARKISGPEDVLEEEVRSKVTFAKQGGGYIFQSDHSVPDSVSLAQYTKFVEFGLKYGRY
jgi:uroporphyrinogen decarboxylase